MSLKAMPLNAGCWSHSSGGGAKSREKRRTPPPPPRRSPLLRRSSKSLMVQTWLTAVILEPVTEAVARWPRLGVCGKATTSYSPLRRPIGSSLGRVSIECDAVRQTCLLLRPPNHTCCSLSLFPPPPCWLATALSRPECETRMQIKTEVRSTFHSPLFAAPRPHGQADLARLRQEVL